MKATPSTAIKLDCPVERVSEQQGPENISWAMLKGGKPVHENLKRFKINDTSLLINSFNANDSGWYRCVYTFGQIQRCSDVNLLVQGKI